MSKAGDSGLSASASVIDRAALRNSESRRADFEYDSQRRTEEWDLTFKISKELRTAFVRYTFDTDHYEIQISGREFDQPVTDYEGKVWDRLVQTVLTLHENAHVLFTDYDDLQERLEARDQSKHFIYQRTHNAFEDGRIEVLIRAKYPTYSTHILHFRANFMKRNLSTDSVPSGKNSDTTAKETADAPTETPTIPDDGQCTAPSADGNRCGRTIADEKDTCWQHDDSEACAWDNGEPVEVDSTGWSQPTPTTEVVGFMDAITMGALDRTTYNSEKYDKLTDPACDAYRFASADDRDTFMSEIHPRLEACAEDVVDETDAEVANERIFAFVDEIIEHFDTADNDGVEDAKDAADNGEGPGGMPDDSGRSGKPSAPPEQMPDMEDESDDEGDSSAESAETDENDDEGDDTNEGGAESENEEEAEETDASKGEEETEIETDDEIADEIAEAVAREADQCDPDTSEDGDSEALEAAVKAANGSGALSQETVEDVPNAGPMENQEIWSNAESGIKYIKQRINLDDEVEGDIELNQRQGAVHSPSLVRAVSGDSRDYKKSYQKPDVPEFNFCFLVDRSGSMHSSERKTAISAVVQFARALASYRHVNVMVVELYEKEVRRALPLGSDPHDYKRALLHDSKGGGTPLTDALALARERLGQESGSNVKNRVFVVTDGSPDDTTAYEDELDAAQMPVVGLSVTNYENAAGAEFYHRHKTVPKDGTDLTQKLAQIASELTEH